MPALRKNDAPIPYLTSNQLINLICTRKWFCEWIGSSGSCLVRDDDGVPKLVMGYKKVPDYLLALDSIKLRLTTEGGVPEEQILFEEH